MNIFNRTKEKQDKDNFSIIIEETIYINGHTHIKRTKKEGKAAEEELAKHNGKFSKLFNNVDKVFESIDKLFKEL